MGADMFGDDLELAGDAVTYPVGGAGCERHLPFAAQLVGVCA